MSLNVVRFLGSRAPTHYHLTNGFNLSRTALFTTSANKCVRLKIVQPTDLDKLGYEEKNTLLKRAQSPHLTIYKFPFPSMLSISHRFTGLILTGFTAAISLGAILPPSDISYWVNAVEGMQLSSATLAFIKFHLSIPITYHTLNGVRHLFWDNGKFLKMDEVYKTGWAVVGLSILSAMLLAVL